jgi:hypothetical protein
VLIVGTDHGETSNAATTMTMERQNGGHQNGLSGDLHPMAIEVAPGGVVELSARVKGELSWRASTARVGGDGGFISGGVDSRVLLLLSCAKRRSRFVANTKSAAVLNPVPLLLLL